MASRKKNEKEIDLYDTYSELVGYAVVGAIIVAIWYGTFTPLLIVGAGLLVTLSFFGGLA